MRIVSLVPSLTELLLYLETDVVGRTKFCIHPTGRVEKIPKIGGTKTAKIDHIIALKPDLVIANKEENTKADVDALTSAGLRVWVSDISDYSSAVEAILTVGKLTGTETATNALAEKIGNRFANLPTAAGLTVCYLIWRKPYMTVGGDTYIHSILSMAGFANLYEDHKRYPEVDLETLSKKNPDAIFLSSEPFPFAEKHIEEIQAMCPQSKVILVDGEVFSWYGSKMLEVPEYLAELLKSISKR